MAEKKAFKATERKLAQARKNGNLPKSQILTKSLAVLAAGISCVLILRSCWVRKLSLVKYCFINSAILPKVCVIETFGLLALLIISNLGIVCALSILMEVAQLGFKVQVIAPALKLDRINPFRVFTGVSAGCKKLCKTIIYSCLLLVTLCFFVFKSALPSLPLSLIPEGVGLPSFTDQLLFFFISIGGILFLVGSLDYLLSWRSFLVEQSMSHSELRQEVKETEGDPLVKGQRKFLHDELLSQNLVEKIKTSKLVVVERVG